MFYSHVDSAHSTNMSNNIKCHSEYKFELLFSLLSEWRRALFYWQFNLPFHIFISFFFSKTFPDFKHHALAYMLFIYLDFTGQITS